jgi:hypothetical protein
MVENAARRAPTEKFNGLEPARWFIYKRLIEDEANAAGCLSEIVPDTSLQSINHSSVDEMRLGESSIGHSSTGMFSASLHHGTGSRDSSGRGQFLFSRGSDASNFITSSSTSSSSYLNRERGAISSSSVNGKLSSSTSNGPNPPHFSNVSARAVYSWNTWSITIIYICVSVMHLLKQ